NTRAPANPVPEQPLRYGKDAETPARERPATAGAEGANPPRNLSGKRTATGRQLWSAPTTEGEGDRRRPPLWERPMTHLDSPFAARHIGPSPADVARMLDQVGYGSIDELMDAAIPESIRWHGRLDLPPAATEAETIEELRALAARNKPLTSMIGLGYYGTHTPAVIRRNVLESPSWYTAYTPYQPEISQ